jgi:hypothetical protein
VFFHVRAKCGGVGSRDHHAGKIMAGCVVLIWALRWEEGRTGVYEAGTRFEK